MSGTDGERLGELSLLEQAQLPLTEKAAFRRKKPSRRRKNDDLQVLERLSSLLSFTEELKLNRPQAGYQWGSLSRGSARNGFAKEAIETTSKSLSKNGSETETMVDEPSEDSLPKSRDDFADVAALPKRTRKPGKTGRAEVGESTEEVGGTSDWIHYIFDERESYMHETRSKLSGNPSEASVAVESKSMQSRIHNLAATLADTRAALQSGREALWQTDEEQVHREDLSEYIDAEDALEFRENAIIQARNELNTTRAQVSAVEGSLKVEIMEAHRILEEKNRRIERARNFSMQLRTARIVWPNHANEVFLTGSFNGWNGQIQMDKSSAGVFVVSLPLYPGKYEIKFVVDGSWRVDTQRPIVYVGGFENNVLTVS